VRVRTGDIGQSRERQIGRCYTVGFEDEGWGRKPRNAGGF